MTEPIIKVQDLSKCYGDKQILKNITFMVHESDTIVLIGPSGTGKSTLLRCINLLTKADGGRIWLGDEEITVPEINEDVVRRNIGMVFQDFLLFNHLTAMGNVKIGLTKVLELDDEEAERIAMDQLKRVGLEENAEQYPGQLSGGQKQRVAIARSLAMN